MRHELVGQALEELELDSVIVGVIAGNVGQQKSIPSRRDSRCIWYERRHVVRPAVRKGTRKTGAPRIVTVRSGSDANTRCDRTCEITKVSRGAAVAVIYLQSEIPCQLAIGAEHNALRDGRFQIRIELVGGCHRRRVCRVESATGGDELVELDFVRLREMIAVEINPSVGCGSGG